MNQFYGHRIFKQWLRENKKYFKHPPRIVKSTKQYIEVRFHNMHPRFTFVMQKGRDSLFFFYGSKGEVIDIVRDFDSIDAKRSSQGNYYCGYCRHNNVHQSFESRYDLYVHHIFEPLLKYINQLDEKKYFIVMQEKGWNAVQVEDEESIIKKGLEQYPRVKTVNGKGFKAKAEDYWPVRIIDESVVLGKLKLPGWSIAVYPDEHEIYPSHFHLIRDNRALKTDYSFLIGEECPKSTEELLPLDNLDNIYRLKSIEPSLKEKLVNFLNSQDNKGQKNFGKIKALWKQSNPNFEYKKVL